MAQDLAAPTQPVELAVAGMAEVPLAADSARQFAASLGFAVTDCDEIALVVTELASNLVRHAAGGGIRLSRVERAGLAGIRIESEDSGPGICDVEQALTDGYSTGGSLGIGLGTVNRLMDELDICSRPSNGVHVICQRWPRPATGGARLQDLVFGAATRSCRRQPENGDAFLIARWEQNALAGVIDGLGHGPFAQRAAQAARQYVEQHFDQPLDSLFRGAGRACRATRGVVMALARFDLAQRKVTVGSIGNIEVRMIGGPERFNMVVRRGVIGLNAPNPVLSEHPWTSASLLIMHSDGLRTHWEWSEFPDLANAEPEAIAQRLLRALGKIEDDATILVAGNAHP